MQIREKGKLVLCIRTEYVPEKKRTIGKTVARQDKYMSTVSDEVREALTPEEADQLQEWLDQRAAERAATRLSTSLDFVATWMGEAADALDDDSLRKGLSSDRADAIWQAHERLSKALRRHGFKKPQKPAKQRKQRPEQQGDLPLTLSRENSSGSTT